MAIDTREVTKGGNACAIATTLRPVLCPSSVALIGASRFPGTIGYIVLQCLLQGGFTGTVYPVNPNARSVMSVRAYPSILDVPDQVDLAIIAVPAKIVCRVAGECGQKGVAALIVISDGFRESGPEGEQREKELRDIILRYGMRLVGPNCMGVLNTDSNIRLNATFSPVFPSRGNVSFLSQSGAMGLTILEYAENLNIGISTFVSVGNRVDISSNDMLEYWENDAATRVILLYLESFGNPRHFARIARRVSRKKPIVVVKSGGTQAGSLAAASHTGAMVTPDINADVLFQHAGIMRVNLMEELFDLAALLSNQPLPKGRRLTIVTNGGGPGILAADAAARTGLVLPTFPPEIHERLKRIIKRNIVINNPLDTTAGITAQEFGDVLKVLATDESSDAVLAIFIPPVITNKSDMEAAISSVAPVYARQRKPMLACFLGERGFKARLGSSGHFIPCYPFPEDAVAALARAVQYTEIRKKPKGKVPRLSGIRRKEARRIVRQAVAGEGEQKWLTLMEMRDLLDCYGIRFIETREAGTAEEAAEIASGMGFPVAVKLLSPTIVHKTEVGGVVLDINSPEAAKKAFRQIKENLARLDRQHEMTGVAVQRMVKGGTEAIAGVTQDPSFGPLIMFGFGGVYAELVKDITIRLHPLTDMDAREMITSVKMSQLFEGYRGAPPSDMEALQDLLLRLSAMVEDIPEIQELDFNPVKVMPAGEGYHIVDARIRVQ